MKKLVALILAALLALSSLAVAFAATYTDKDTVKKVQQALNDAGYNCGTPDGIAGKKTAAAIADYQKANGLEASGVIDDALLKAMGLTAEEKAPQEQPETAAEEEDSLSDEEMTLALRDPDSFVKLLNSLYYDRLEPWVPAIEAAGISRDDLISVYYLVYDGMGKDTNSGDTIKDYYSQMTSLDYSGKYEDGVFTEVTSIELRFHNRVDQSIHGQETPLLDIFLDLSLRALGFEHEGIGAVYDAFLEHTEMDGANFSTQGMAEGPTDRYGTYLVYQADGYYLCYRNYVADDGTLGLIMKAGTFEPF